MQVKDKVALVAGGASGLGRAVCEDLASCGALVAVVDRDGAAADLVAEGLGGRAVGLAVDVTSPFGVEEAVTHIVDVFGAIHINVNTAGIASAGKIVADGVPHSIDLFEQVISVNLVGTFNVMRVAIAAMLKNDPDETSERGIVINTASAAAFDGQVGQVAYSASKAGVIGMALPLARDLAGTGVRVNTIAPGLFETPMAAGLTGKVLDRMTESIVEPSRPGRPAEFAALVRHIIENPYLNAECIRIDAGLRLPPR